ncbi:hypothetical protein B0T25DRAFT_552913 [Lasiosphaeria hispida]|uniref:RING-type E3 ubiquitin transferase n=1 Tax=Lasiosphaeria hispida TaxID=260671 RepID=A0AAJ0HCG3_9PEZI|nr:hypothetical protein B0T25DRAFT_552913 [Lasiosphaeria hispida]
MATPPGAADDIKVQVLQTTLAEISSSRQNVTTDEGNDAALSLPDCCVICLDAISEPCTTSPCGHTNFDFLCLTSWLQQRASCPLCQSAVYKVRYRDAKTGESVYRVPNAPRTRNTAPEGHATIPARESREARRRSPEVGPTWRRRRSSEATRDTTDIGLLRPAEAIQRRRLVYRHQLYSQHVGSNRRSLYRLPPTPSDFTTTPHLVSRARLWIRRELQVFAFLSEPAPEGDSTAPSTSTSTSTIAPQQAQAQTRRHDNAEFLLEYIIAILKTVDTHSSSGQAEDMLSEFLGRDNARLFLHELRNWLRSPAQSLVAWDREVQYPSEHREGSVWTDERGGQYWRPADGRKRRHEELADDSEERPARRRQRPQYPVS